MTTQTLKIALSGHAHEASAGIHAMADTAQLWFARARQRRQLESLSGAQLDDLGISRTAADREAAKPFWRA